MKMKTLSMGQIWSMVAIFGAITATSLITRLADVNLENQLSIIIFAILFCGGAVGYIVFAIIALRRGKKSKVAIQR
jgi:hypothetical protein